MKAFNPLKSTLKNQAGMTLIEIMIVLAIIAGIAAVLGSRIKGAVDKANVRETKIMMSQVIDKLNMYNADCGRYPKAIEALLTNPGAEECPNWGPTPYIDKEKQLKDAWNRPFTYESDGSSFTLKSLGKDGKEGGSGIDADITSDEL